MAIWAISEAKNRFSELVDAAQAHGARVITRHGSERAVVLSVEEYNSLKALQPDFKAWLLGGPKVNAFEVAREPDFGRDVAL